MSWWIGLDRRQLAALASVTAETTRTPLVPILRYRMDGTPVAEQWQKLPLIGEWNRNKGPRRKREAPHADGLEHQDRRRRHAEGAQPALNKAQENVFLEWT